MRASESKRARILVSGNVQGVFYRSSAADVAQKLGLAGWVKNTFGGGVEIVVEGEKESIEKLIEWCGQGPDFAKVENVEVAWEKPTAEFSTFETRF